MFMDLILHSPTIYVRVTAQSRRQPLLPSLPQTTYLPNSCSKSQRDTYTKCKYPNSMNYIVRDIQRMRLCSSAFCRRDPAARYACICSWRIRQLQRACLYQFRTSPVIKTQFLGLQITSYDAAKYQ